MKHQFNNIFIENFNNDDSFLHKFYFNKKFKLILLNSLFFLIFLLLIAVILFFYFDQIIIGSVSLGFLILSNILFLIYSYINKKAKNKFNDLFNFINICSNYLINSDIIKDDISETYILDERYFTIFNSHLSDLREIKWHTKTYKINVEGVKDVLLRLTYIKDFNEKGILISKKGTFTQLYFQANYENDNIIYLTDKNDSFNSFNKKINKINDPVDNIYSKNKISNKLLLELKKKILFFNINQIKFDIFIENKKINYYLLLENNFLNLRLEEINKFKIDNVNKDLEKLKNILKII